MPDQPELFPPEHGLLRQSRFTKWRKPFLGISATGCFGFVLWGVTQFFSLRGVVNMVASRIVLALTVLAAIGMLWFLSRFFEKRRTSLFVSGVLIVVCAAGLLDWWAPKIPKPVTPPKIIEKAGTVDTIAPPIVTHPSPEKKLLRQAIGDLIQEGTKIRDEAPVWVEPPATKSVAKAWDAKVERFIRGNFDSAELAKYRSLNDPNQSLNSIMHWKIKYLEDLLDRVGM